MFLISGDGLWGAHEPQEIECKMLCLKVKFEGGGHSVFDTLQGAHASKKATLLMWRGYGKGTLGWHETGVVEAGSTYSAPAVPHFKAYWR